jgi:hypothetical protein
MIATSSLLVAFVAIAAASSIYSYLGCELQLCPRRPTDGKGCASYDDAYPFAVGLQMTTLVETGP